MKRPGFFEGVAVALAASVGGAAVHAALRLVMPGGAALRLVVAGLGLGYLLYLLGRSPERVGRVTSVAAWGAAAVVAWLVGLPLSLYLLVHLGLLWLVRSLYFHTGVLAALADGGLGLLALAAALWVFAGSGSLWLSLWSFFLVQALFVTIPCRTGRDASGQGPEGAFERAHHQAEQALRRLASIH